MLRRAWDLGEEDVQISSQTKLTMAVSLSESV